MSEPKDETFWPAQMSAEYLAERAALSEERWRAMYECQPTPPDRCPHVDDKPEQHGDGRPARCILEAGHADGRGGGHRFR